MLTETIKEAYGLFGIDFFPGKFVRFDQHDLASLFVGNSPYMIDDCTLITCHLLKYFRKRGDTIHCEKYGNAWCWSTNDGADYSIVKEFTTDLTPAGDLEALLKLAMYLARNK